MREPAALLPDRFNARDSAPPSAYSISSAAAPAITSGRLRVTQCEPVIRRTRRSGAQRSTSVCNGVVTYASWVGASTCTGTSAGRGTGRVSLVIMLAR